MAGGRLEKILGWTYIWVNLLALTAGVFFIYKNTLGHREFIHSDKPFYKVWFQNKIRQETTTPMMYSLPPFSTNLGGNQFIRLAISLETPGKESLKEIENRVGPVRDAIIRILNSQSFEELETVQGKLRLKNQMISQVNHFLHRGVIQNIYFSEFAIQ